MKHFGIFSPAMGVQEDMPSILIEEAFFPKDDTEDACSNVRLKYGEVHRCKGRIELYPTAYDATVTYTSGEYCSHGGKFWKYVNATPGAGHTPADDAYWDEEETNPARCPANVLRFHWFQKSNGSNYLFAFTAATIYKFDPIDSHWDEHLEADPKSDLGGGATFWSVITFNDKVIATCGVNKVVLIGDDSNSFDYFTGADTGIQIGTATYMTAAKYVTEFENHVIFGYTYESAAWKPQRIRWCAIGDYEAWNENDTDDTGCGNADVGYSDFLSGFGKYQSHLIVFKERSYHRLWLTGDDSIFAIAEMSTQIGTYSPASIINGRLGQLYFLSSEKTIREIQIGEISQKIDPTLKKMPDDYLGQVEAMINDKSGEIWWSIPTGDLSGGVRNNNLIVVLKDFTGGVPPVWSFMAQAIQSFGEYKEQKTYTWDTLPYATWEEWLWDKWDTTDHIAGYRLMLGSGYSDGKVWRVDNAGTDDGSAFTGYFLLSTDLANRQALNMYKRLLKMHLYFKRAIGGTVDVYVKRDNGSWETVATSQSLSSNQDITVIELPCDYRAKHFKIKVSAANHFEFIGVIFDFVFHGKSE